MSTITTLEELAAIYGQPAEASVAKEVDRVTPHYRALVEASPFAVLATAGPEGLDCSLRGDAPGFIRFQDDKTLLFPDRRGNNRVDSLRNIVRDPRGVSAELATLLSQDLLNAFETRGNTFTRRASSQWSNVHSGIQNNGHDGCFDAGRNPVWRVWPYELAVDANHFVGTSGSGEYIRAYVPVGQGFRSWSTSTATACLQSRVAATRLRR